ncbi:hypothetical protein ACFXI3_15965 [Amycolatopsis sp. NPDC059235]|uniref:hypothetical protein n=1 Tax=Amycolatopsis sp. NPDC059235 TaxID=3346782 RepID=UPI00366FDC30
MITLDAGVPALTRLGGVSVGLFRLRMGEFTVHASMPEAVRWATTVGWRSSIPAMLGRPRAAGVDFGGYCRIEPSSSTPPASSGGQLFRGNGRVDWRSWPWPAGLDPFLFMVHASPLDDICLLAGGTVRPVTDPALGAWLRRLPALSLGRRSLEDPVVVLTCTGSATRQELADRTGRLVWFVDGPVIVGAEPLDPAGRVPGGRVLVGVPRSRDGRVDGFRSVYPRGPAGDRVRWALGRRFAARAAGLLVEASAAPGTRASAHARPLVFGGRGFVGLSYFDARDRASRAAVLGSSAFATTYAAWTPNHAYLPGLAWTPPSGGTASAWNLRELGVLPFDPAAAVIVTGYFADGRFAVYDRDRDVTCWETPTAFGHRLARDIDAARTTATALRPRLAHAVLLTDFQAVPDAARAEIARRLRSLAVITANAPSTLFLDHDSDGVTRARIALLPGNHATTEAPEWTSTTVTGISTTLPRERRAQPAGDALRRSAPATWTPPPPGPAGDRRAPVGRLDPGLAGGAEEGAGGGDAGGPLDAERALALPAGSELSRERFRTVSDEQDCFDRRYRVLRGVGQARRRQNNCLAAQVQGSFSIMEGVTYRAEPAGPRRARRVRFAEELAGAPAVRASLEQITEHMRGQPENAMGLVYLGGGRRDGHYVLVHKDRRGVVNYLDAQAGRFAAVRGRRPVIGFVPLAWTGAAGLPEAARLDPGLVGSHGGAAGPSAAGHPVLARWDQETGTGPVANGFLSQDDAVAAFGAAGASRLIRFSVTDVKCRALTTGDDVPVGSDFTFDDADPDPDHDTRWAGADERGKFHWRGRGEPDTASARAALRAELGYPGRVQAPGAEDYARHEAGPIEIIAHGDERSAYVTLPAGTRLEDGRELRSAVTVAVSGHALALIVDNAPSFQAAYRDRPWAALRGVVCEAGSSGVAEEFMDTLHHDLGYPNTGFFYEHDIATTTPEPGYAYKLGDLLGSGNAAWKEYSREPDGSTRQTRRDEALYPEYMLAALDDAARQAAGKRSEHRAARRALAAHPLYRHAAGVNRPFLDQGLRGHLRNAFESVLAASASILQGRTIPAKPGGPVTVREAETRLGAQFTRASLDRITAHMRAQPPGAQGVAFLDGNYLLVHTDQRTAGTTTQVNYLDAHRGVIADLATRLGRDDQGRLIEGECGFLALTHTGASPLGHHRLDPGLVGGGQSVEAEWAHPIHVEPFESDAEDDESMDIEVVELHETEVLAHRRGAEVIMETQYFYQDDQDRLHATKQGALAASAGSVRGGMFGLPELVVRVMPHLPGEARDTSLDEGRAVYRMVSEALAGIPGAPGDLPGTALADVLRPQDGWDVTDLGDAAWIGPPALGADGGAVVHFNVGVPPETGFLFRQHLQAQTSTAWGSHTLTHRHDALRFADEVTAWYLSWRALGRISDRMDRARSFVGVADLSAQAVRSHVLSAYIHAAAIFTEPATVDPVKYHAADLTRHEPKDLRRALPAQSQEFLRLFAERIYRLMMAMAAFRIPDRDARARSQPADDPEARLQVSNDNTRLYWEAALTDRHDDRYVMRACFKRMTVLRDFDVVDGIPLAVVEVRCYGASKYLTYPEMAQAQDRIADAARHAHAVAQRLRDPTPDMLSDFEATLQELRAHDAGHSPTSSA